MPRGGANALPHEDERALGERASLHQHGALMKVLVAYASKHGATEGIAEHIASTLCGHGADAAAQRAEQVEDAAD